MKKIKRGYYYLFYKFYKMSEAAPSRWLSDWKSTLVIVVLELWLLLSIGVYYAVITKTVLNLTITKPVVFIPFLIVLILNYVLFLQTDTWKMYVSEFDSLPKYKNKRGNWIVFGIVLFVFANLIFSFYLISRVDWSQYR